MPGARLPRLARTPRTQQREGGRFWFSGARYLEACVQPAPSLQPGPDTPFSARVWASGGRRQRSHGPQGHVTGWWPMQRPFSHSRWEPERGSDLPKVTPPRQRRAGTGPGGNEAQLSGPGEPCVLPPELAVGSRGAWESLRVHPSVSDEEYEARQGDCPCQGHTAPWCHVSGQPRPTSRIHVLLDL